MLKFVFFVCLLTSLAGSFASNKETQSPPSEFMYAIFKDRFPVCAGALVEVSSTTEFILTAAHCVYGVETSRLDVLLKNAHFDDQEALRVHQVFVHPYYMPPSRNYDIAFLKVKVKAKDNRRFLSSNTIELSKLNVSKTEPSSSDTVSLVNWDLKAESNELKILDGSPEDRKSCRMKLANYINVSSKMLCANFQSDTAPDGGPLLFKDGIVGIASWRKGNLPIVFTNVANSEIYSFIEKYT